MFLCGAVRDPNLPSLSLGRIPKEASTLLDDGFTYQPKMLDLASASPEPWLLSATDKHHSKHQFVFLRKANTVVLRLMHFTGSGWELLFLMALAEACSLEHRDAGHAFVCTLPLPLLEKWGFIFCSLPPLGRKEICEVNCHVLQPAC